MNAARAKHRYSGFTLIEMLIVIAVIGVLASLIIAAITNASQDSQMVVARQQQAVMQEALTAWITAQGSLASARNTYAANPTASQQLAMISNYLAPSTYSAFTASGTLMQSEAMASSGVALTFTNSWGVNTYPTVNMVNVPSH
jgi:prepilin-type N-terminal cleavage/methylation domain-containing protein